MIIDNEDFKTFFEVAFNVLSVNELKCFKCGKRMAELEDLSALVCSSGHRVGYLEYMTTYANMLKDIADNADFSGMAFQKKVIEPSNIMYAGNEILFNDRQIIRS